MADFSEHLHNYRNFVAKIDARCGRIVSEMGDSIACRDGCDHCCRHISLFPVEALAVALALQKSPPEKSTRIRELAASATMEKCPLLENGGCLLYEARPIICRTHGLPLLISREGDKVLDFCPRNFKEVSIFPSHANLDLDLLNATLAAINAVFTASIKENYGLTFRRMTMAEALLLNFLSK